MGASTDEETPALRSEATSSAFHGWKVVELIYQPRQPCSTAHSAPHSLHLHEQTKGLDVLKLKKLSDFDSFPDASIHLCVEMAHLKSSVLRQAGQ